MTGMRRTSASSQGGGEGSRHTNLRVTPWLDHGVHLAAGSAVKMGPGIKSRDDSVFFLREGLKHHIDPHPKNSKRIF
jgi:hypothetical protein